MSRDALTIVFADVSGSTKLFEQRGDEVARRIISGVLTMCAEVTHTHQGSVIKTIGDEIMVTFPSIQHGIEASIEIQRRITRDIDFVRERVGMRIGLHHGDVLVEDNDVFGDAVNTAARMAGLAKREQIVTTAASVKDLTLGGGLRTRSLGKARVAGKLLPIEIVDIIWQEDTSNITTVQRAIRVEDTGSGAKLTLRYRGEVVELNDISPPFSLGRDPAADIVVDAEWVSRNHASIEYRRGYFVLSDRSTNGTFVRLGEDDAMRLHRDELQLRKTGGISLGQSHEKDPSLVLYFQCSY